MRPLCLPGCLKAGAARSATSCLGELPGFESLRIPWTRRAVEQLPGRIRPDAVAELRGSILRIVERVIAVPILRVCGAGDDGANERKDVSHS